jgi:uncharacterized protein YggE
VRQNIPIKLICRTTAALFLIAISKSICLAQTSDKRLITTSGQAEVRVAPDKTLIRVAVKTKKTDLLDSVRSNNATTKKVLAVIHNHAQIVKSVKTSNEIIKPDYEYNSGHGYTDKLIGYEVEKNIVLEVTPQNLESLITEILSAGANEITGIEFSTTHLREVRDQARLMAVTAAKDKAIALATELGQKIGRPWLIQETAPGYAYFPSNNIRQNSSLISPPGGEVVVTGDSIELGLVSVEASVTVSFELVDP